MKNKSYLILLIVVLASYSFLTCSEFGEGSQNQTLPTLYRLMNSDYLPNDWYVNQTYKFDVRYYYNHLIIRVNSLINNLEWTVLLLHCFSFILFHISLFFLIYILFKNKTKALFITLVIFISYPVSLGATSFFKGNFSPNGIAWALVALSLYFYFKEKYFFSFFVIGLASIFSLADVLPMAGILIINLIISKPLLSKNKLINVSKSVPFFLISAFLIIPLFFINKTTSALSKLSAEIVSYSHSGHILPSSWKIPDILPFVLLFFFFIFIFKRVDIEQKHKQKIKNFIWIVLIYCLIGTVFVEILPIAIISKLMLFRTTKIISLFGYVFIGSYLFTRIKQSSSWLEKVFFISFPIVFLYPLLLIPSIPILFIIDSLEKKKNFNIFNYLVHTKKITALLFTISTIFLIFFIKFLLKILPPERTALNAVIPYIILPAVLYFFTFYFIKIKKKARIFIVILIFLTLLIGSSHPLFHIQHHSNDEVNLFNYVRDNSLNNAIFLIPPSLDGFRVSTNRPIVIDMFFPFTDLGIAQWYIRIKDTSNNYINKTYHLKDFNLFKRGYLSLTESDLLKLKNKYNFDYVIFEKPKDLSLGLFYQNEKYIIYKI